MAKAKKKRNVSSAQRAHVIAARRRDVARLAARGFTISEISQRCGVAYKTAEKDLRTVEEQWWQHTQRDYETIYRAEVSKLEVARQQVLNDYYDCANRHGETHQTAYMAQFVRLTQQLHELMRLNDPAGRHQSEMAADESVQVVEVAVETRRQAEAIQSGVLDFDLLAEIQQVTNELGAVQKAQG